MEKKAQINQIGAENFGVVERDVGEAKVVEGTWGIRVDVVVEQVDEEKEEVEVPILILWHVTGAGCMAIWPVTVPAPGTQLLTSSVGSFGPSRGISFKSGRSGPKRGKGRHVRFTGMNILYDSEGCEYPIDDYGQVYVPFELEQLVPLV